jgi:hypothetical protein
VVVIASSLRDANEIKLLDWFGRNLVRTLCHSVFYHKIVFFCISWGSCHTHVESSSN